jgi:hypothetical protein
MEKYARVTGLGLIIFFAWSISRLPGPDVTEIISRSVEVIKHDWDLAPRYDCFERDRLPGGTKTYENFMIDGSPYQMLVKINGKPLLAAQEAEEKRKMQEAISTRNAESPQQRQRRIENYQKTIKTEHDLIQEMTKAFEFHLAGQQKLNGFDVYVLNAKPRPGYQPSSAETQVLSGMKGKLWIEKRTFQWVKVEAQVIRSVTIYGFVARVEPGTNFELERMSVGDGVWLPKHLSMRARVKIFYLFGHRRFEDITYFDCRLQKQKF